MDIKELWQGRTDGETQEHLRWHQIVGSTENVNDFQGNFVVSGFCCDEGVARNKGRVGSKEAPDVLRKVCSNFPVQMQDFILYDAGNIFCYDGNLENVQENLTNQVQDILLKNGKSVVFGGGHEVTFAHFMGVRKAFPDKKIGIINFDAHFDNRKIDESIGATSGTGFYQIAEQEKIHSLTIGIQKNSNTQALFNYADEKGMQYILANDFTSENTENLKSQISNLISEVDYLYVTVCMDVFSSAFAPGVSATAYNGLFPDNFFMNIFKNVIKTEKLVAFDIAEVNPTYDIDNRTAKLASSLIFELVNI